MLQSRNSMLEPGIKAIIMISVLLWLFDITNANKHLIAFDLYNNLGMHYWESDKFKPWQMVSYMFMHDRTSFLHLFFNMFNLWMFGNIMEQKWGTQRFLLFYFVCGIGGAFAQQAAWSFLYAGHTTGEIVMPFFGGEDITAGGTQTKFIIDGVKVESLEALRQLILALPLLVGASAGTFGIMVAFAMTFPNMPLYFFFIPIPIKAKYMIGAFVLIELMETVSISLFGSDGVAHLAHIGGVIFGVLLLLWWRKTGEDSGQVF